MRTEDGSYVGGEANSFILFTPDNHVIYFTGDTALHGDMKLINDYYKPDICLMCMGGDFAMGPCEAAYAVDNFFLNAKTVVPMHWGTQGCPGTPAEMAAAMKRKDINFLEVEPGKIYELYYCLFSNLYIYIYIHFGFLQIPVISYLPFISLILYC